MTLIMKMHLEIFRGYVRGEGGLPWSDWPKFGVNVLTRITSNNLGGLYNILLDIYDILKQYLSLTAQQDDARHENAPLNLQKVRRGGYHGLIGQYLAFMCSQGSPPIIQGGYLSYYWIFITYFNNFYQ